jgi:vacuolar-type H+-ATPase subunit D/Vma8
MITKPRACSLSRHAPSAPLASIAGHSKTHRLVPADTGTCLFGARRPAAAAALTALAAAARHAAAALAVIEAATAATRNRLRAVRDRWIPGLSQALAEVQFALEEMERDDAARLRIVRREPARRGGQ